ncbi:MAG TPA: UDP-2,3-diacylglucosamine diphosphatase LpxI [Pirellulaceae bacterium]|nr:UDP-2,3-diacylglucosamine diphosphatase LpxI [Pirellulaceae bacterium]
MTSNPQSANCNPQSLRIGLVAGWGRYPIVVAQTLKAQGKQVYCVGLENHADPSLATICDDFVSRGVARIGQHIRYFRRQGVTHATMAGKVFKHKILFGRFGWLGLLPDWRTIRVAFPLYILGRRDRRDDTLLSMAVQEYAKDGIIMAPATDLAPQLLAREGQLTRRGPTKGQWQDIEFGWNLAKELGRLDVGQSVTVKGRAVIAVEAVEGTDACIRRSGEFCPQGGFTVVKVAKPQQDMRFDVPTIGVGTIESMLAARASVLAIEASKTIIVDEPDVVSLADKHGLAIVALCSDHIPAR